MPGVTHEMAAGFLPREEAMRLQAVYKPTAAERIDAVIHPIPVGSIVSVRDTIAAVRKDDPFLQETDCELVEIIVDEARFRGQFVLFDIRES